MYILIDGTVNLSPKLKITHLVMLIPESTASFQYKTQKSQICSNRVVIWEKITSGQEVCYSTDCLLEFSKITTSAQPFHPVLSPQKRSSWTAHLSSIVGEISDCHVQWVSCYDPRLCATFNSRVYAICDILCPSLFSQLSWECDEITLSFILRYIVSLFYEMWL